MTNVKNDIEWEINQVDMAIDYFERQIEDTFFVVDAEKFEKIIHRLNSDMKKLEKKRDRRSGQAILTGEIT